MCAALYAVLLHFIHKSEQIPMTKRKTPYLGKFHRSVTIRSIIVTSLP